MASLRTERVSMTKRILITGGAGFIGSHLADELLTRGHHVRVFDNLLSQVHGHETKWPPYLNTDVELIVGDVQDSEAVAKAVRGVDAVFHFAAMVGVGQSMYEIRKYTSVNNLGRASRKCGNCAPNPITSSSGCAATITFMR